MFNTSICTLLCVEYHTRYSNCLNTSQKAYYDSSMNNLFISMHTEALKTEDYARA